MEEGVLVGVDVLVEEGEEGEVTDGVDVNVNTPVGEIVTIGVTVPVSEIGPM